MARRRYARFGILAGTTVIALGLASPAAAERPEEPDTGGHLAAGVHTGNDAVLPEMVLGAMVLAGAGASVLSGLRRRSSQREQSDAEPLERVDHDVLVGGRPHRRQ